MPGKKIEIVSLKNDLPGIFACLLAFFMPFLPKAVPVIIALMVVSSFVYYRNLKFHREYFYFALFSVLFYMVYAAGMLYTGNTKEGRFDLEVKLSFFIIPIFFLFYGTFKVSLLRILLACFSAGCFVASWICLYYGYQCYSNGGNTDCFFSSNITGSIHATYLSVYFCFAILISVYFLINYFMRMSLPVRTLNIFLVAWFAAFVLLLSSKGGFLALVLVVIVSVVYYVYKAGKVKRLLWLALGLVVLFSVMFSFSAYIRSRLVSALDTWNMPKEELFEKHRESTESTAVRLMIWTVAKELISEHPAGVGTGNNKTKLLEEYKKRGMTGAWNLQLNCHNQYLETTLSVGFHGVAVLVLFLMYTIIIATRNKNFLLLWVVVIVALNLFFESFLERQAGIVFFVFFSSLLVGGRRNTVVSS